MRTRFEKNRNFPDSTMSTENRKFNLALFLKENGPEICTQFRKAVGTSV
jgi:hypothetical protein